MSKYYVIDMDCNFIGKCDTVEEGRTIALDDATSYGHPEYAQDYNLITPEDYRRYEYHLIGLEDC